MSREKGCTCSYMYCRICCKSDTKNCQKQSKVWNKGACTTICKDILAKHQPSSIHREALEHKHACHVVKTLGGIKEAMQGKVVLQRDHVIGAMISHNFSLPPFRQQKNMSV